MESFLELLKSLKIRSQVSFSFNFAVVFSSYRQTIRRLSSHRDGDGDVKGEGDGDGEGDEGRQNGDIEIKIAK